MSGGTDDNCAQNYPGPYAWSESEARAIRDFYESLLPPSSSSSSSSPSSSGPRLALSIRADARSVVVGYDHSDHADVPGGEVALELCEAAAAAAAAARAGAGAGDKEYSCLGADVQGRGETRTD